MSHGECLMKYCKCFQFPTFAETERMTARVRPNDLAPGLQSSSRQCPQTCSIEAACCAKFAGVPQAVLHHLGTSGAAGQATWTVAVELPCQQTSTAWLRTRNSTSLRQPVCKIAQHGRARHVRFHAMVERNRSLEGSLQFVERTF